MSKAFSAESLMAHVRVLAGEIGPRPAGHPEEMRARQYVRQVLHDLGYYEIETLPFLTSDTWGYGLGYPLALALAGNLPGRKSGRTGRFLGSALSLFSGYTLVQTARSGKQPLAALAPRNHSATLLVKIPPVNTPERKLVLLGHLDTNKNRHSFKPQWKKLLLGMMTFGIGATVSNGIAQLAAALGAGEGANKMRKASALAIALGLLVTLYDEEGGYVDGANDNATAVACLLGLAAHLKENPLQHTEVWLAFTGAEEVGCVGAHALLDAYSAELRDAWFLDFEMVGTEEIAYVTRHSGLSNLSSYTPDAESLDWAITTAQKMPELNIQGKEMVITEEVGTLRGRGYRGLCLVGVGEDGWLANWHQYTDDVAHIEPSGLEKAARFAWAMMEELDAGVVGKLAT
ncbi:MAG: M20/M25/M40 family metallo-hydrolase [Anaerolineae bacterium]|nr:M20/M25/M40 family metallo-hydrolase [Anaerolineae bacterium]